MCAESGLSYSNCLLWQMLKFSASVMMLQCYGFTMFLFHIYRIYSVVLWQKMVFTKVYTGHVSIKHIHAVSVSGSIYFCIFDPFNHICA